MKRSIKTRAPVALAAVCLFVNSPACWSQFLDLDRGVRRQAVQSLVKITAGNGERAGTGIVVGKTLRGLPVILTANQVIAGFEDSLSVQMIGDARRRPARLILEKWRTDEFALIACRSSHPAVPALRYNREQFLLAGSMVSVLGFSRGLSLSQNAVKVLRSQRDRIDLDFALPADQFGAPVMDAQGRVIGLAIGNDGSFGRAVPIELVQAVVENWLRRVRLAQRWQEGKDGGHWYGWIIGGALVTASAVAIALSGVLQSD